MRRKSKSKPRYYSLSKKDPHAETKKKHCESVVNEQVYKTSLLMALIQYSPLRGPYYTSVIYEAKRNQNITLKSYKKGRRPIWDLNP